LAVVHDLLAQGIIFQFSGEDDRPIGPTPAGSIEQVVIVEPVEIEGAPSGSPMRNLAGLFVRREAELLAECG
jgi:hypothetical protein